MPVSMNYIYGEKMTNPLSQYFRQPAIYIRLPSGGEFYPQGTLDMPANYELPVLPMTAIDEITYRTPDALFNGTAVVNVIESCIPNIKDAWVVPSTDLDTLLVGIRIATYGHEMDVNCTCPKCSHEDSFLLDLRSSIDMMKPADYRTPLTNRDMEIYFQPMTYKMLNQNNQLQFEEQKVLQALATANQDAADQQSKVISAVLEKITSMTVKSLSQSIGAIKTPSAIVTDNAQIEDFLKNCDKDVYMSIRDYNSKLRDTTQIKPLDIKCPSCSHQYEQLFTLNVSDFFG